MTVAKLSREALRSVCWPLPVRAPGSRRGGATVRPVAVVSPVTSEWIPIRNALLASIVLDLISPGVGKVWSKAVKIQQVA